MSTKDKMRRVVPEPDVLPMKPKSAPHNVPTSVMAAFPRTTTMTALRKAEVAFLSISLKYASSIAPTESIRKLMDYAITKASTSIIDDFGFLYGRRSHDLYGRNAWTSVLRSDLPELHIAFRLCIGVNIR